MRVPFLDLHSQYQNLKTELDTTIQMVIDESAFVRGRFVDGFEEAFATLHDAAHCVGVGNGTDALFVSLKMIGVGPGDEVITAANSWIATSEAVTMCGAMPVFADVDPDTYTIDPRHVESLIGSRTRAVLPVHLFGHPADMSALQAVASRHGLAIVEDCAQAHLATYNQVKVGGFGQAGAFSFYPGKNLGAYGDAGAVVTNDDDLAVRVRMFANHGSQLTNKHEHPFEGVNSRLDGLQAAVLSVKMRHIERWTEERRARAQLYSRALAGIGDIVAPVTAPWAGHVFHVYCIRTSRRDALRAYLSQHGVETSIHYPIALPFLGAYEELKHSPADFPVSHHYQGEMLSLPIYPELLEADLEYIAETIRSFFAGA